MPGACYPYNLRAREGDRCVPGANFQSSLSCWASLSPVSKKKKRLGTGEMGTREMMAQQLKAPAALAKESACVPSTHIRQLSTFCNSSSWGYNTLFWPSLYIHRESPGSKAQALQCPELCGSPFCPHRDCPADRTLDSFSAMTHHHPESNILNFISFPLLSFP